MAEITAALVKELREVSGAGMMDCKKALSENGGNLEEAVDWLRKKGLSAAAKKAGRVAAEGLVAVVSGDKKGVLVEVNSETDFVARNDQFQGFVSGVAQQALNAGDIETLKNAKLPDGQTVAEKLTHGDGCCEGRRCRDLHAQRDRSEHGEDRRARRIGIDR